jgi:dipeptidyl aminopeptidase/acylaminoacyl peptidase
VNFSDVKVSEAFVGKKDIRELTVSSTLDGSEEKVLLYHPRTGEKVPLVVGLHTWSYDRFNQVDHMLPYCLERGWALLLPEFRGPNLRSNPRARQACASPQAVQDVVDALETVVSRHAIDTGRVYLLGGSGGGHMALIAAARHPGRWAGVSAWVPITDLAAWHGQNPDYAPHVEACCGGAPGSGALADGEYRERSPLTHCGKLSRVPLSVHHGRHDPIVPYSHSWKLALELERLEAERFFFDIFDGGHDIHYDRAFSWFDRLAGGSAGSGQMLSG